MKRPVVLGVVRNKGHILLVRSHGESRWWLPGGKIEPGESEAEAVVREVREETGVVCDLLLRLGQRIHPDSQRPVSYWLCEATTTTIAIEDVEEIAEAQWVSAQEARDWLGPSLYEPLVSVLSERG